MSKGRSRGGTVACLRACGPSGFERQVRAPPGIAVGGVGVWARAWGDPVVRLQGWLRHRASSEERERQGGRLKLLGADATIRFLALSHASGHALWLGRKASGDCPGACDGGQWKEERADRGVE